MHNILPILLCIGLSLSFVSAQGDLEKLTSDINTDMYDETTPVISFSGDKLFFTRTADPDFESTFIIEDGLITSNKQDALYFDRLASAYSQIAGRPIADPSSSVFNQDIWFSPIINDMVGEAIHPGYPLNNALPNSLVSTGMNKDEYVILNQFYEDGSMYAGFSRISIDNDSVFQFPTPMHIYAFDVNRSDVTLTMTSDGHILVLSMNRSDSKGQNDLYVSFYVRENVWSAPLHMGTVLNTSSRESTPHISPDKRFLYFSSNRPGGMGGNDIYVSERLDFTWLNWSEPTPVTGNVNTRFDESQPYFDPAYNYMYFTSKRDGSSDIFRKRLTPTPRLKKPLYVKGRILNSETGLAVRSELFWGQVSGSNFLEYFNSYTGVFEVSLTEYDAYKFQPRKVNYTSDPIRIDPRKLELQGVDTLEMILYVTPKEVNEKETVTVMHTNRLEVSETNQSPTAENIIAFYDINFVKGKAIILAKSRSGLHYLLDLMNSHPTAEILITGHTDNVGDEKALIELSMKRALAIKDYLVHRGIREQRIQVDGMGASRPLFENTTEKGREQNRRVEVSMINPSE